MFAVVDNCNVDFIFLNIYPPKKGKLKLKYVVLWCYMYNYKAVWFVFCIFDQYYYLNFFRFFCFSTLFKMNFLESKQFIKSDCPIFCCCSYCMSGELLSVFQQWYTSSMNVVCTWLTDRMDLQLHIYQLKTLIRIVKVHHFISVTNHS